MLNSKRSLLFRHSALAFAVATASAGAYAADETDMWYINPQAGYSILDNSRNVDDDFHFGFGFGYHAAENFSLEFNGLYGDFEGDGGRTLHQSAYSLDGLFVFKDGRFVQQVLFAAYQSMGAGQRVDMPFDAFGVKKPIDLWFNPKR